jgi:hypothetical protein
MTGRTCELKVDRTTIGRSEDNAFPIADPSVSSHHCEVLLRGQDVVVRDLNSTNGTYINGVETKESVIKPAQILRLGQIEMRLEPDAPATPAKKHFDRTIVIPGGVNRNEFDPAHRRAGFDTQAAGFSKRGDKINRVFILIGVILGTVIGALLVYIFSTIRK